MQPPEKRHQRPSPPEHSEGTAPASCADRLIFPGCPSPCWPHPLGPLSWGAVLCWFPRGPEASARTGVEQKRGRGQSRELRGLQVQGCGFSVGCCGKAGTLHRDSPDRSPHVLNFVSRQWSVCQGKEHIWRDSCAAQHQSTASVQDCTDLCTADKVRVEKTPTNAGCGFLRGCYNVRL